MRPDPEAFIEALDPLQPRLYSIASSPKVDPGRMALCIDAVRYPVDGRTRLGVASTFLGARVHPGDEIKVYVQKAAHFGLPADASLPVIMIGPGTGIAPFRAFLHERMAAKAPGRNWLFFGHQRHDYDFFYEDELTGMKAAGVLTRLSLAWSRDGAEKFYVQDRMREVGRDLWAWLADGAHVYVCGDAKRMARDVEGALGRDRRPARRAQHRRGDCLRRQPQEVRPLSAGRVLMASGDPPRMAALARLPIFLALEAKRAVVAGDGPAAAWKAELLSAAGAEVDVLAENPCEELRTVATQAPRGAIALHSRAWRADDFAGAAIAVGGFDDDREAERFATAARAAGVPVNVIDKPAHCDFSFGAIVNRSPLVIGISTDGAAPVFGQSIRAKLEAMIPRGFACWADAARRWRAVVQASGLSFNARRSFWQAFTSFAVSHPDREPAQSDLAALLDRTRSEAAAADAGSVTLVGAGPGDPELLTLRAVRALQAADIILIDDLVAPEILDFARREARKMLVGGTGSGSSREQDEISALMITLARAGRRVVRLAGGDPMLSGRAGGEIAACRAAGIAVEVVPGIMSSRVVNSPGTPPRACCGSPAAPPARTAAAPRSAGRG